MVNKGPQEFLQQSLGEEIEVGVNTGEKYIGKLLSYDSYNTLCLGECRINNEEYPMVIIRGSSAVYVAKNDK